MSRVLSLALKITGDASGVRLTPVERALKRLGEETDKVGRVFDRFAKTSDAGQRAQQKFADDSQRLTEALKSGAINSREYADQFARLAEAANQEAAALERAARITEANIAPQERFARTQAELNEQFKAGRITQETYERALAKARQQLDGTSSSADKTDKSIESLTRNVRILSTIEIGRAIIDGLQVVTRTVTNVTRQLGGLVNGAREALDQIDKLSLRTGIGRDALQEYGVAAELSGVSVDELGATFQRLAANIGRANPPAELQQGLRQLNLNINELRRLAPEDQFALIAQRISELPSATERAGAAFGVLGEQGVRLTSLLGQSGNAIEEVRQRTRRLGIIVSDQQIANVTRLNDTFTLVQRTIGGIIGQVVGNLAPAVTAVAEEFLQFVEAFEGTGGLGGDGLARTISTTLLDVADYFASKFDEFASYLSGFSITLSDVGEGFSFVANVLTAVSEGFRTIFNLIQVGVSALTAGLGKVLEGIGSWVDSDLEEFGRNLAEAATAEADKNVAEMEDAARRAAAAFNNALDGGTGSARAAGEGAASRFFQGVRAQFEREQAPEFQVTQSIDATAERLSSFLATAGEGADEFLQKSVETLKVFEQQADAGQLTAAQIQIMTGFTERLNQQLDAEVAKRQEAATAATQQAEADAKRIAELTKTADAATKLSEDIAAVEREIARVRDAATSGSLDAGAVQAAEAQIAQLERLRDTLDGQLEASSLGFAAGFDEAFASTQQNFAALSEQALEFGQAGFDAASRLQEGIAAAQEQARDGILNAEAYEREVRRQQELFTKQLEDIRTLADERRRVNEFVDEQLALQQFGGDSARLEASRQVAVLEAEIARVQQEIQQARDAGNQEALAAGIARIGQLDQVAAKERDIASGRAKFEEEIAKQREGALKAQEAAAQKQQEAQRKAFEEQARAAAEEADRQERRIRSLNSIGQQSIGVGDIRSTEGANQFIQAAAGAFDPNLAELRAQSKLLRQIVLNSGALQYLERGIGSTFQFLGGGA